jgi:hypothetical protein
MSIIRGAASSPFAASERVTPGGSAVGRVVRTLFYAVGIAAGIAYVAGRSRPQGASGDDQQLALSHLEARLARLETPQGGRAPTVDVPAGPGAGRLAQERRLAALERRLTAVERTREARRSLLFVKPNGTSNGTSQEDRRHG